MELTDMNASDRTYIFSTAEGNYIYLTRGL